MYIIAEERPYILKAYIKRCTRLLTVFSLLHLATDLATATCLPEERGS